jgi:hypothetical protein
MRIWDDDYKESISILIYWYVESNQTLSPQSLLMTQSAFELLSWIVLTHIMSVNAKEFKKKSAAAKFRDLLSYSRLPFLLPKNYQLEGFRITELPKILDKDKRENGASLQDIPGCIVSIRNRIAHPPNKSTKQNITKYTNNARIEATRLSLWYLELCLLHWFGYQGEYSNRLKSRNSGDYEKVPWIE